MFIAIVGPKKSGKTTAIETLTRELTKKRYRIAVVKHIPEANFTIDTKGKDTWRFAQAGATKILSVSSNEIATIEKTATENMSLKRILEKTEGADVVFIEGFRNLVNRNPQINKIAIVASAKDVNSAMLTFKPILAFTGEGQMETFQTRKPYMDISKNSKQLAGMIEELVKNAC